MTNEQLLRLYFEWLEELRKLNLLQISTAIFKHIVDIARRLNFQLDKQLNFEDVRDCNLVCLSLREQLGKRTKPGEQSQINKAFLSIFDDENTLKSDENYKVKLAYTKELVQALFVLLDKILNEVEKAPEPIIAGIRNKRLCTGLRPLLQRQYSAVELNPLCFNLLNSNFLLLVSLSSFVKDFPKIEEKSLAMQIDCVIDVFLPQDSPSCPPELANTQKLQAKLMGKLFNSGINLMESVLRNTMFAHQNPVPNFLPAQQAIPNESFLDKLNKALGPQFYEKAQNKQLWWTAKGEHIELMGQSYKEGDTEEKTVKGKNAILRCLAGIGIKKEDVAFVAVDDKKYSIRIKSSNYFAQHMIDSLKPGPRP